MMLINHDYYIVELNNPLPYEVIMWLGENFGSGAGRWFQRHPRLYFADPKDHLLFCLRWS